MANTVKKNQTADIPTKSGGKYSYQYVDIAQIHEYLESIGASYYQYIDRIDDSDYIMTVKIIDGKEQQPLRGARIVDATLYGNDNPAQKQGSAITYARRYSLLMAFGLATEDDDAQSLNKTIPVYGKAEEPKATEKQIGILEKYYTGDNLDKLLFKNGITDIKDLPIKKASELISELMKKQEK